MNFTRIALCASFDYPGVCSSVVQDACKGNENDKPIKVSQVQLSTSFTFLGNCRAKVRARRRRAGPSRAERSCFRERPYPALLYKRSSAVNDHWKHKFD